ncbi:MAG: class IIb bacteriocin, lactobin A/cerein 7B family [Gammaproteobacteria bacterium]|nr:class IIb bacteriocin, lactobin A/cerein 7B family [Gammaproteobacteria bacterium]
MRELNAQEIEEVSGGFLPLVAFGLSFAGHLAGFSGPITWAISSAGLILSTIGAAMYFDS